LGVHTSGLKIAAVSAASEVEMPQPEWMRAAATLLRIAAASAAANAWLADSAFATNARYNISILDRI
jgi:hypothetical protein